MFELDIEVEGVVEGQIDFYWEELMLSRKGQQMLLDEGAPFAQQSIADPK